MGKDTLSSARTPGNVLLTARSSSNGSSLCTPARPSSARGIAAVSITGNVARVSLCARQSYRLLESPSFLRASSRRSIVSAGLPPAFSSSRLPIFRSRSGVTYRSHQPRSITITQIVTICLSPSRAFPGAILEHPLATTSAALIGIWMACRILRPCAHSRSLRCMSSTSREPFRFANSPPHSIISQRRFQPVCWRRDHKRRQKERRKDTKRLIAPFHNPSLCERASCGDDDAVVLCSH